MKRTTQGATLNLQLLAALGVLLTITTKDGKETPLLEHHEDMLNLKPGDSVTIAVKANTQWEEAQRRNAERAAQAAETDDVDHRAAKEAGAAADARAFGGQGEAEGAGTGSLPPADANAGLGAVTSDTGTPRTRSTGKAAT